MSGRAAEVQGASGGVVESGSGGPGGLQATLSAVAAEDRTAFRSLYQATAPKLFGIILRITGNRSVAEDALQDVYVKVWQKASLYRPESGQPMAWLAAIARNSALDRIRARRVERTRENDDEALIDRLAAEELGPDTREALRECLATLDEEERRCVILAYCSGYSREELAERFQKPVGTIKTMLHRTIRALRTCLERE